MIWEPFVLALVLGLIVSAGLYFAYLWPSVEPVDTDPVPASVDSGTISASAGEPTSQPRLDASADPDTASTEASSP